jgi:hypothetical protein
MTTDPNVVFSGTTTGTRITIGTTYVGAPPTTPAPSGLPIASAAPSAGPHASSTPVPSAPPPLVGPSADITVTSGAFSQSLVFPVGHWRATVTSYASGLSPVAQDVEILVQQPPVTLIHLNVFVAGKRVTLRVLADGVPVPGLEGGPVNDGDQFSATATSEFCLRTSRGAAVSVTLDNTPLGLLGGGPGSWIIKPGQDPQPAPSPC